MTTMRSFLAFLFLAVSSTVCLAQGTGAIHGSVTDPSDLAVPGAAVTAKLVERGTTRTVQADSRGEYVLPALPVGSYVVTASSQGFKQYHQEGIELTANENVRVDIRLQLGSVTESVSVTTEAPLVDSRSSAMGALLDNRRVLELPINGRNVISLVGLMPGVTTVSAPQTFTGYNDGPSVTMSGSRGNGNLYLFDGMHFNSVFRNTGMNYPPPDALQEVKVLTNNFSAEYGRNAGGVFNVVSRSGTNQIHGTLWEFLRNQDLNARSFFAPSAKPKLVQNQYGAAAGGPIRKDKLFVFGSYEGLRVRPAALSTSTFPLTEAERTGDFSATKTAVRDPLSKQAFPGNMIPADRVDAVAKRIMAPELMPLPNRPNGQRVATSPQPSNNDNLLFRVDYNRARHTFEARYNYSMAKGLTTAGQVPEYLTLNQNARTQNVSLADTIILTPSLINQVRAGFSRWVNHSDVVNKFSLADLGGNFPVIGGVKIPPAIAITGRLNLGAGSSTAQLGLTQSLQLTDALTWTKGGHTVKTGFEFLHLRFLNRGYSATMGSFSFTGSQTGVAAADFFLGKAETVGVGTPVDQDDAQNNTYYYVQDDWRVRPRLTLNLGLRYELPLPWVNVHDLWGTLIPGRQSQLIKTAPVGMVFVGDPGVPRGIIQTDKNNFAPRIGFAWDLFGNGRTSLRGGYGIFYEAINADVIQNTGPPFRYNYTFQVPYSLTDPLRGQIAIPLGPNLTNPTFPGLQTLFYPDAGLRTPYFQHFNLNVQRQVLKDTVVEVGYIGKLGRKLLLGINDNWAPYQPGATLGNLDQRRILQGYGSNTRSASAATAAYHGLQAQVNKRYSRNFTVQGTYTFSRSLDIVSNMAIGAQAPQPFNLASERGLANFHRQHVGSISAIYDLPRLTKQSALVRYALGSWQLNGLFTAQSGAPLNVTLGSDVALSGTPNQRPDLVGIPWLPTDRSTDQKLAAWFDRTAFARPAAGMYGNVGRNTLLGPGSSNVNLGLFKTFSPQRFERLRFQFRSEFFSVLNHPNFGDPNTNFNAGTRMGQITSAGGARVIQFALKTLF